MYIDLIAVYMNLITFKNVIKNLYFGKCLKI